VEFMIQSSLLRLDHKKTLLGDLCASVVKLI
jgi:hypothetical protein